VHNHNLLAKELARNRKRKPAGWQTRSETDCLWHKLRHNWLWHWTAPATRPHCGCHGPRMPDIPTSCRSWSFELNKQRRASRQATTHKAQKQQVSFIN